MTPQLGSDLQHALHASKNELEVVDPSTNERYVIVAKERWLGQTATGESALHDNAPCAYDPDAVVPWTDEKNRRRGELVDREIAGTLTDDERTELGRLQREMRAYRERVAPLPIEDTRQLHAELMEMARQVQAREA